ncbi:hypothetical protein K402DRAFT_340049 [Aulographum hederae CBS 113979]|uniref:Tyrosine--tRNA ligase n=1 Tax=Aulographum hederae CBS 113979 TaxID=1176131 RepID=A0A6G1GNL2_9PEZI|nr:hypothetical protein K402DRAFT_340049 [Aulographum hederae CBS 113979]
MATPLPLLRAARSPPYICARCSLKRRIASNYARRLFHHGSSRQTRQESAPATRESRNSLVEILEQRGYINQIAGGRDELAKILAQKRTAAYVGIDPTAASLHVGHLMPFMALFWLYIHGFHAISLVGGATASVGDPTGRLESREQQDKSFQERNMRRMYEQVDRLWGNVEALAKKHGHQEHGWRRNLLNNKTWLDGLTLMHFLQTMAPNFRLGAMLSRDTVKNKMEKGDGMSFAEFTYPLLQAWDWWHMYQHHNVQLQIGGSDQFGNIVTGIDAVNYASKSSSDRPASSDPKTPIGFTVPLLLSSSGVKFGKSTGNAIWLDESMTSVFDLYGFLVGSADADVERYLKLLTFVPLESIRAAMQEHDKDRSKRVAQHLLAREFVELVHGEAAAEKASNEHRLFSQRKTTVASLQAGAAESTKKDSETTDQKDAPETTHLAAAEILEQPLARAFVVAGLVKSRSEGETLIKQGGAYVGMRTQKNDLEVTGVTEQDEITFVSAQKLDRTVSKDILVDGKMLILRSGKWKVRALIVDGEV